MRTARSSSRRGGLHQAPPTPPQDQTTPPPREQAPLPPVNRITDTCKNITFPQLRLRAVIIIYNANTQCSLFDFCSKFVHLCTK